MGGKTSKRKGRVIPAVQSDTIPVTSNTHHTNDELQNEFYEIKNIATTELKKAANKVKDVNNQDNLGELWKNIQRIKRRNIIADIFIILTNPNMNQDGNKFINRIHNNSSCRNTLMFTNSFDFCIHCFVSW